MIMMQGITMCVYVDEQIDRWKDDMYYHGQ